MGESRRRRLHALKTAICAPAPPSQQWLRGWRVADRPWSLCATPLVILTPCREAPVSVDVFLQRRAEAAAAAALRDQEREAAVQKARDAMALYEPHNPPPQPPRRPPVRGAMVLAMLTGMALSMTSEMDVMHSVERRAARRGSR